MSCRSKMFPGAMFMMVGLLPLAGSQAHAQSSIATSLAQESILTLPSEPIKEETDSSDLTGDLELGDAALFGVQDMTAPSHAHSGFNAGWLVGGTLGLASGLVGLSSGGGSAGAATLLRTPAPPLAPTVNTVGATVGNINSGSDIITTPVSTGNTTGAGSISSGGISPFGLPGGGASGLGGISVAADTPEPGSLAILGGMGLTFTIGVIRRRKRSRR